MSPLSVADGLGDQQRNLSDDDIFEKYIDYPPGPTPSHQIFEQNFSLPPISLESGSTEANNWHTGVWAVGMQPALTLPHLVDLPVDRRAIKKNRSENFAETQSPPNQQAYSTVLLKSPSPPQDVTLSPSSSTYTDAGISDRVSSEDSRRRLNEKRKVKYENRRKTSLARFRKHLNRERATQGEILELGGV